MLISMFVLWKRAYNVHRFNMSRYLNPLKGRDVNWLHLAIKVYPTS